MINLVERLLFVRYQNADFLYKASDLERMAVGVNDYLDAQIIVS